MTGTLHLQGSFTQTAGAIRLSGGTLTTASALDIQGGSLEGSGLIQGDVQSAGAIAPGFSAGALSVDGNLTMLAGGELRTEVGGLAQGVSYDFVPVSGTAALAGRLVVSFLSGFESTIDPGDQLTILEATSGSPLTGSFAKAASGQRVVATPGLGSFVVSYGAGSATGAQRVVLHDFRPFAAATNFAVGGTAQGGSISLTVAGVEIVVVTTAGQTASEVAAAIADAINASTALDSQGIAAIASGDTVSSNGGVQGNPLLTDPGLTLTFAWSVPSLQALPLAILGALLAVSGARAGRRARGDPR